MPCGITRPNELSFKRTERCAMTISDMKGGGYEEKEDWAQKTLIDLT